MAISAKKLAEILGVSPATISMVMNNKPGISDETKERILAAAEQYGYINKKAASASQSSIIQLVVFRKHQKIVTDTPFFAQLTEGITQECINQNCVLHISYLQDNESLPAQIAQLEATECAGILLLGTEMAEEDFKYFEDFETPLVVLDCYFDSLNRDCITINNIQGAYLATQHLIQSGHRKIGYIGSNIRISNFKERSAGYRRALRLHDIQPDAQYDMHISPNSIEAYQDMSRILDDHPVLADAYFADNDIIAAAAIRAFREHGYRLPEDISIIGFDDMPLCDMMDPPLSTMRVDKKVFGAIAVKHLISFIHEENPIHMKLELNTTLVKRHSVISK